MWDRLWDGEKGVGIINCFLATFFFVCLSLVLWLSRLFSFPSCAALYGFFLWCKMGSGFGMVVGEGKVKGV